MITLLSSLAFASQPSDFLERVAEMLLLETSSRLELPMEQVEVLHLGLQNSSCPEDANISVFVPQNEDFRGMVDAFVEGQDQSGLCGKWRIRSRVAVYKTALVAQHDTAPGDPIMMVKHLTRYDLSPGTPVPISSQPREARTQIRAGELVTVERSQIIPVARDGAQVSIIVKSGSLQITSDGALMGDANIGDSVRVISAATRQVLDGTLVDSQTVNINVGAVSLGGSR